MFDDCVILHMHLLTYRSLVSASLPCLDSDIQYSVRRCIIMPYTSENMESWEIQSMAGKELIHANFI